MILNIQRHARYELNLIITKKNDQHFVTGI